mmetsp:Transcript_13575/g.29414  ORF Transcript_13575/g.29414 Transcript_13575/m.29414 type:complete len:206 (+) Transcript_13575:1129-1746(+)
MFMRSVHASVIGREFRSMLGSSSPSSQFSSVLMPDTRHGSRFRASSACCHSCEKSLMLLSGFRRPSSKPDLPLKLSIPSDRTPDEVFAASMDSADDSFLESIKESGVPSSRTSETCFFGSRRANTACLSAFSALMRSAGTTCNMLSIKFMKRSNIESFTVSPRSFLCRVDATSDVNGSGTSDSTPPSVAMTSFFKRKSPDGSRSK